MTRTHRIACVALVVFGLAAAEGCSKEPSGEATAEAPGGNLGVPAAAQEVTVVGRNSCLGCALKKAEGAAAQCSKYGHRHALEVESVSGAAGATLAAWRGRTLHYLENDQAAPLATGDTFHGKRVEVKGRLFPASATIEVQVVRER